MTTLTDGRTKARAVTRLHGLDALRAGALLLGIVLHSLLPFIGFVPWLVVDSQTSWVASILVFVIHLFRMALFMLLAGFFGRLVLQRRGASAYLRDRVVRILLPFIAFWPLTVLPLAILAVINSQVHGVPLPTDPNQPATTPDNPVLAINPGQLWFLWVLMQCVLVVLAVRAVSGVVLGRDRTERVAAWCGRLLSSPAGLLFAAVPYAVALGLQGHVLGGINAPANLLPSMPALTAYLGAFAVGWALHARSDALARIARHWPLYLVAAGVLTVVGWGQSDPASTTPLPVAATVMALAGWTWVYGLLGLVTRWLTGERGWVRYLADASYWMYLVHLPLLVGFEILLVTLDWPIMVKLALTWLVVGALLVISYHLLVRSTVIGRWLNGHRYPFRVGIRRSARAGTGARSDLGST